MSEEASSKRIALVGCGAVTENFHLPALAETKGAEVTVLVDRDVDRAKEVAENFKVPHAGASAGEFGDEFDAAIVALPHFLHADVSCDLLALGKDVLVEKPMAIFSEECQRMLDTAAAHGAKIAVGQMRRHCPAVSLARMLIQSGAAGEIQSVEVADGVVFGWPVKSDFQFRKDKAGGGVLFDTGSHTLDMLISWFGLPEASAYRDDALEGGVEADCEVVLKFPAGFEATVDLSRTRNLPNRARIHGSACSLDVYFYENRLEIIRGGNGSRNAYPVDCNDALGGESIWSYMFLRQCDDWVASLHGHHDPIAPGEDARRVVDVIQSAYGRREKLDLPWIHV